VNKGNIVLFVFLALCLIVSGCSFSESSKSFSKSSKSISKSASSPSRWSARSNKKGENSVNVTSHSYQDEVAALTVLYVKSGGTTQDFQEELSTISRNHGIIDWENNKQTYKAIGIGLKESGISKKSIKTMPFLKTENFINHYTQITSGYYLSKDAS
jgi:hypothetical protein